MGSSIEKEFPKDVGGAVKGAKKYPITMKGSKGYFISDARMSSLKQLLEFPTINEESGLSSDKQKEYDQLLAQRWDHDKIMVDLKSERNTLQVEYDRLVGDARRINAENNAKAAETNELINSLRGEIDTATRERNHWREEVNKVQTGCDVDRAPEVMQSMNQAKAELKAKRNELDAIHKQKTAIDADLLMANSRTAKAKVQLDAANKELSHGEKMFANILREDVKTRPIDGMMSNLEKYLGKKGMTHLLAMEKQNRENARERAFQLLLATKASNSAAVKSLTSVIQILFEWLKDQVFGARKKIIPWLDMIAEDMKNGALKSVAYYRKKLDELIGNVKVELAKKQKAIEGKEPQSWFRRMATKVNAALKGLKSSLTPAENLWSSAKSVLSSPFSWISSVWSRPKIPKRNAFVEDAEEEKALLQQGEILFVADEMGAPSNGKEQPFTLVEKNKGGQTRSGKSFLSFK